MILSSARIRQEIEKGSIVIDPFDPAHLGPNSYDVRLADELLIYDDLILDMRREPKTRAVKIPPEGLELQQNQLYLGRTMEYTETHNHVPMLEGRSSLGRLGLAIHVTAGFGDRGFCGSFTCELFCIYPIRVYPGVRIGQIYYLDIDTGGKLYHGKYNNDRQTTGPIPSKLWRELGT